MLGIDRTRCRPEYEAALFEDLRWLGLDWEEPVRRQSDHFADYRAALDRLGQARLLYPCFCTRKDIAEEIARADSAPHGGNYGPDGPLYPGTCRALPAAEREARLASGIPYALRLDVAKAQGAVATELRFMEQGCGPAGEHGDQIARPERAGDVVLARKGLPASYHLAVVVDDALQGVTLVTRGNDLFAATHIQRLLQALLGLAPPAYAHHRLVLDARGRKFSKRDHAVTLAALAAKRHGTPHAVRALANRPQAPE